MGDFLDTYLALLHRPWFLFSQLGVAGLLAGSFSTMLIHRLPLMLQGAKNLSLTVPASHCPNCRKKLAMQHNIPLLGYFLVGGRCANCRKSISVLYPLTELSCLFIALICGLVWGGTWKTVTILPLFWGLFALTVIDWRHGFLPDRITLALLWLGLFANSFGGWTSLQSAVWGAAGGYLFLSTVNWLYWLLRHKEGLGGGDMKLLAALGAYFGWTALLPLILISSVTGCLFAAAYFLYKRTSLHSLPWGPHLAFAGFTYPFLTIIWSGTFLFTL